jgi:hypothetical protein
MSNKAKTITIQTPSGRIIHTAVPGKTKSAPVADLSILGTTVKILVDPKTKETIVVETGFTVYEVAGTLDIVLIRAQLEGSVKGIGAKTLEMLIAKTKFTPEKAVLEGIAKFTHSLQAEGYYILEDGTHVWAEKLPEPKAEESKSEETSDDGQSHF